MKPLSNYWDNHLRVAFETSAVHDLPAMVEASIAHVLMLAEVGSLPAERARVLLGGLRQLWPKTLALTESPDFDGSVEDPYYWVEKQLAVECGIATRDLDVQLARSRNDLDAAVFRMILRADMLQQWQLHVELIRQTCERAAENAEVLIWGHTHRRPAQPTSVGHVLSGLADAWLAAADYQHVFQAMNVSPLGGAAFAGTDIGYDAQLVAELLGFEGIYNSSYEAISGADHFLQLAALHGRLATISARWARVAQEWMSLGWIETPLAFTQGSSIMPQKVNPVVCEHLASYAGATIGDLTACFVNVGQGWYEDSNNATTDIQQHLWRTSDRTLRTLKLQVGLMTEFAVKTAPSVEQIVTAGVTTTSIAETLSKSGVAWGTAHDFVHDLAVSAPPTEWDAQRVGDMLARFELPAQLLDVVLSAGTDPSIVLRRSQPGSSGADAVRQAVDVTMQRTALLEEQLNNERRRVEGAREEMTRRMHAALDS